jgi:ATP-dependent protease HslVU (ClpYQ) peptidase subunit
MSIVCCRVTEKKIEVASDSILTIGMTQNKSSNRFAKLVQVNGMIVGGVGDADEMSLFLLYCTTHHPERADESGLLSFVCEFVEWKKSRISDSRLNNGYLVAYSGKIFCVDGYFVQEIISYEAIGAGMDFALAALYLGHDARRAAEVSCELSILCEAPIVYYEMERNPGQG